MPCALQCLIFAPNSAPRAMTRLGLCDIATRYRHPDVAGNFGMSGRCIPSATRGCPDDQRDGEPLGPYVNQGGIFAIPSSVWPERSIITMPYAAGCRSVATETRRGEPYRVIPALSDETDINLSTVVLRDSVGVG